MHQLFLIDSQFRQQPLEVVASFGVAACRNNPIRRMPQLLVESRKIAVNRDIGIAQALVSDNQRQRDTKLVDIARKKIQQHKQLLVQRRQMVLATAGLIGGHGRHGGIHKAVQQRASGPRF